MIGTCIKGVKADEECSISCNEGYEVVGTPYTCKYKQGEISRGELSVFQLQGTGQSCVAKPAPLELCAAMSASSLPANSLIGSCGVDISLNANCSLSCSEGYKLTGNQFQCVKGNDGTLTLQGSQQCSRKKAQQDWCLGFTW